MTDYKPNISTGSDWVPPRMVWYGDEKVGKTSTAASAPSPLFLGTDDGRRRLGVPGLELATSWGHFVDQMKWIVENAPGKYETVVLDTLNGVVDLCAQYVCDTHFGGRWHDQKNGFLAWGGSKGWAGVAEEFRAILPMFDALVDKGIWVIILAHSKTEHVTHPSEGEYDRFSPAVDRRVWARIGQWADNILRVDSAATFLESDGPSSRKLVIDDGRRVFKTTATAGAVAGCRVGYELPDEIPFAWEEIESRLGSTPRSVVDRFNTVFETLTDAEKKKALKYLGITSGDDIETASIHKVKSLVSRLESRDV